MANIKTAPLYVKEGFRFRDYGGYKEGYEDGMQTEYDRFWDSAQESTDFTNRFAGRSWTDITFKPKHNIIVRDNADRLFANAGFTDLEGILKKQNVTLDTSMGTRFLDAFNYCVKMTAVPEIVLGENCITIAGMFVECRNLVTIRKMTFPNKSLTVTNAFGGCTALENIEIGGTIACNGLNFQWSTKLTHDSLMSIINALKDYSADTSGTVWTVTIGSENYAKLTEEEILIAEQKGWDIR